MGKTLFILNDPPYGSERSYNGLRLAGSLIKRDNEAVRVFLIGDAVVCAKGGQKVPSGYYKIENMLRQIVNHESEIGVCSGCMDARGMTDEELTRGCRRGDMEELADWTQGADRVLIF
ncbi:MAG: hypothetical protein BMS9Abin05_0532 [Rhodothermia bacterium]|nr:MAG: hypothetical protein BMS9Abin05_0532 [Rhodothermia bacterium]